MLWISVLHKGTVEDFEHIAWDYFTEHFGAWQPPVTVCSSYWKEHLGHFQKWFLLCCTDESKSYEFATTSGWVNDDRSFVFGRTVLLMCYGSSLHKQHSVFPCLLSLFQSFFLSFREIHQHLKFALFLRETLWRRPIFSFNGCSEEETASAVQTYSLPLSPTRNYSTVLSLTHTHTNKWIRTHAYSFNSSQPYRHIPADNLKAHANTNQISHVHTLSFSSLLSTRTHAVWESFGVPEASECTLCVFLH